MNLSNIRAPKKASEKRKRVGRGMGSGMGKTSTRGHKGQRSRTGSRMIRGFEGGQMPLHRRLPKRGFTNIFRKEFAIVNLGNLDRLEGDSFDPGKLLELGLIRKLKDGLKILGSGELKRKIHIKAHLFSESALEKIKAAGGTAEVIPGVKLNAKKVQHPGAKAGTKPKAAAPKAADAPKADAPETEAKKPSAKKEKGAAEKSGDKGAEKTTKPKQAKPSTKEEK
jgi:large subunit ribosomal protein L15